MVEILPTFLTALFIAVLLVGLLILLIRLGWVRIGKDSMSDYIPGLHMKDNFYSDLPRTGTFAAIEHFAGYNSKEEPLSYTTRSSNFEENMSSNDSLHERESHPTPASNAVKDLAPNVDLRWIPSADIPINIYADGNFTNMPFSEYETMNIMRGGSPDDSVNVAGAILKYSDFNHRDSVTM